MPSSISSSSRVPPAATWPRVLGGALVLFALAVAYLELRLALRGFRPTVVDTEALWVEQRARAATLGQRALILVGGSRIQLDVDLEALRARSGLEPVQLAVDGSSFRPVLAGLARDPRINGTVLIDFSDHLLTYENPAEPAYQWQAAYERASRRPRLPDFERSERWLTHQLRQRLRSYADGAQPLMSLIHRILPPRATQQYLITLPDRSRLADYAKVPLPAFYHARVLRNLGGDAPPLPPVELEVELRRRVAAVTPRTDAVPAFREATRELVRQAQAIRARGGRVVFIVLPTSGLVRELEERRFPRAHFWDAFAAAVGRDTLHFTDVPAWRERVCPDGSHLDFRQRALYTAELVEALGLARAPG